MFFWSRVSYIVYLNAGFELTTPVGWRAPFIEKDTGHSVSGLSLNGSSMLVVVGIDSSKTTRTVVEKER